MSDLSENTYSGGTPNTSNPEYWNGDIAWVQSSDIIEHKVFGVVPKKYITSIGLAKSAAKLIPANSIAIVTRVGVGKLAVMPFDYSTSQDFLSLSNLKTNIDFTAYLLYKKMQSELNAVQGTSIKGITKEELLNKDIFVPSIAEQQQIGSYFANLDNLITLHQRMEKASLNPFFLSAWEQRKLGEVAVEVKRKAEKDSVAPVMMISASDGFIDQSQRYSTDNAGSSLKNYTLLYEGELAYNHGYSKVRNFGSVFDLKVKEARIPFVYHSFALPEDDHCFFAYYLNSGLFDGELKKLVSSTARMDGLLNISFDDYMSLEILRPSKAEQEKIGSYLTNLDNLITLHQRNKNSPPEQLHSVTVGRVSFRLSRCFSLL